MRGRLLQQWLFKIHIHIESCSCVICSQVLNQGQSHVKSQQDQQMNHVMHLSHPDDQGLDPERTQSKSRRMSVMHSFYCLMHSCCKMVFATVWGWTSSGDNSELTRSTSGELLIYWASVSIGTAVKPLNPGNYSTKQGCLVLPTTTWYYQQLAECWLLAVDRID